MSRCNCRNAGQRKLPVAYIRTLGDGDFVYGLPPDPNLVPVNPNVQVVAPKWTSAPFTDPMVTQSWATIKPARAATFTSLYPRLVEDSVLIIEARKEHGASKTPSSVRLQQPALVLVQPNPKPALAAEVTVDNNAIPGPLLVNFRTARRATTFSGLAMVARKFFPRRTSISWTRPMRLRTRASTSCELESTWRWRAIPYGSGNPAHTPPPPPLLDIGPQALDITLFVRAMKARSGVDVQLTADGAGARTAGDSTGPGDRAIGNCGQDRGHCQRERRKLSSIPGGRNRGGRCPGR